MPAKPIPNGFHSLTPCVRVINPEQFLQFIKIAFDAVDNAKHLRNVSKEDGSFGTTEVLIGNSVIMIFPAKEESSSFTASLYLYVEDTDKVYTRALAAGGTSLMEPEDMYYGDRNAGIKDAWGNEWWIATHIEDISNEELKRREDAKGK